MNIKEFSEELTKLIEAKELLDTILSRVDTYSEMIHLDKYILREIQNYTQFDDSE